MARAATPKRSNDEFHPPAAFLVHHCDRLWIDLGFSNLCQPFAGLVWIVPGKAVGFGRQSVVGRKIDRTSSHGPDRGSVLQDFAGDKGRLARCLARLDDIDRADPGGDDPGGAFLSIQLSKLSSASEWRFHRAPGWLLLCSPDISTRRGVLPGLC